MSLINQVLRDLNRRQQGKLPRATNQLFQHWHSAKQQLKSSERKTKVIW